jgi:TalC/MipB family fructose-6-phosphate aldolase
MALYIDSAFLNDIMLVTQTVPLSGITTNPSILLAARERGQDESPHALLETLLRVTNGIIFMQPGASEEKEMYAEALTYIEAAPRRVIPKIPMTHTGMRVARQLRQQQHRLAFTAVASVAQAYNAAMIGAEFIIPYYSRLERSGIDASQRIAEMAKLLHDAHPTTRILVASIKSPADAIEALMAGAHDITVAPQVLLDMVIDQLTDEAVEKFNNDWQRFIQR